MADDKPWKIDCSTPGLGQVFLVFHECGTARNCLPSANYHIGFSSALCAAYQWAAQPLAGVYTTIYATPELGDARIKGGFTAYGPFPKFHTYTKVAVIRDSNLKASTAARCGTKGLREDEPGANAGPDPFTIDIPGIQDIIKVKDWESKDLRRERYERFQSRVSALPGFLQGIPAILTKLDNAQDLLFTGLALLYPLFKILPKAFLGPIGWLLTVNDFLNVIT